MAGQKRKAATAGLSKPITRRKQQPSSSVTKSHDDSKNVNEFYTRLMEFVTSKLTPEQLLPFQILPSRSDYPDYYDMISSPISFSEINAKHKKSKYPTSAAIIHDFDLLCSNAQTYNARFSLIFITSAQLYSTVHEYYLLSEIPDQYTQHASSVLEIESRLLFELENYKPRVKNASYMCEPFIDPPTNKHNPEIAQKAKEMQLSPEDLRCTAQAKEQLWYGQYMDPVRFKEAMEAFFELLKSAYDSKSRDKEIVKSHQTVIGLQRSFTSRYDKYIKTLASPPEGYDEWSSEFLATRKQMDKENHEDVIASSEDEQFSDTHIGNGSAAVEATTPSAPASATGRTTTRSAWKQQLTNGDSNEAESLETENSLPSTETKSTGLKLKLKSGPASSSPSSHPLKLRLKSSEKSSKPDKSEQIEVFEKVKTSTPKIKLSFRGTRSSNGNGDSTNNANSALSGNGKHEADNGETVSGAQKKMTIHLKNSESQKTKSKSKALKSDTSITTTTAAAASINGKGKEKGSKSTRSRQKEKENSEENDSAVAEVTEDVIQTEPEPVAEKEEKSEEDAKDTKDDENIDIPEQEGVEKSPKLEADLEQNDADAEITIQSPPAPEVQVPAPVYPNPSRRNPESIYSNPILISEVTFSSVVPTLTKYYQSKNLVPPGSQLNSVQLKFPASEGFVNRNFSLWVPYYLHTFSFNVLLHEWLNTSNYYHVELTHNKTPLNSFKKSDTSPWANELEPIVNRYELKLVTGLNLVELVVVAQASKNSESTDSAAPSGEQGLLEGGSLIKTQTVEPGKETVSASNPVVSSAVVPSSVTSDVSSADTTLLANNSQPDKTQLTSNSRNETPAIRSGRSQTLNTFDPNGAPLHVERLSLWVTMGAAPYN